MPHNGERKTESKRTGCCLRMSEILMRPLSRCYRQTSLGREKQMLVFSFDTRGVEGVDPTLCIAVSSKESKVHKAFRDNDVATKGL